MKYSDIEDSKAAQGQFNGIEYVRLPSVFAQITLSTLMLMVLPDLMVARSVSTMPRTTRAVAALVVVAVEAAEVVVASTVSLHAGYYLLSSSQS